MPTPSLLEFATDDSALHFQYSDEWTIEAQSIDFNCRYRIDLWTRSTALALFFGHEGRSRLLLELIHPSEIGYPESLHSPTDYAAHALSQTRLNAEPLQIAGFPAVRVIPVVSVMPPPPTLMMTENFGEPVEVTPMGSENAVHEDVFYAAVRDDGWVLLISLAAPPDEFQARERELIDMVESLEFDAQLAAIPFVRNLDEYDVSEVALTETFSTTDGILSLQYPSDWVYTNFDYIGEPPVDYVVRFAPHHGNTQISFAVFDVTSEEMGLALDQNSPDEFMRAQRHSTSGDVSEFRIGDFEAVSVTATHDETVEQNIFIALNDSWVAVFNLRGSTLEAVEQHEAAAVAALGSLQFGIGMSYIRSPILSLTLPNEWILTQTKQDEGVFYQFIVRQRGAVNFEGSAVSIIIVNLDEREQIRSMIESQGLPLVIFWYNEDVEGQPQEDITTHHVGHYDVARAAAYSAVLELYLEYSALLLDDDWLMMMTAFGETLEDAHITTSLIDDLIESLGEWEQPAHSSARTGVN